MSGFVQAVSFKKQKVNFRLELLHCDLWGFMWPRPMPMAAGSKSSPEPPSSKPPLQQNRAIDVKPNPA